MTEIVLYLAVGAFFTTLIIVSFWHERRKAKRRETLRRDESGAYVWIDFDGSERRSKTHPEEEGGAWHSEADFGGDIHGGGGDGGGD